MNVEPSRIGLVNALTKQTQRALLPASATEGRSKNVTLYEPGSRPSQTQLFWPSDLKLLSLQDCEK